MTVFHVDYATPSAFESTREKSFLGLAANARRPVSFRGRIKTGSFLIRLALRALGELIWSDASWQADAFFLDPVVTVHDDRVFCEAFSLDESVYGLVIMNRDLFETEGEVVCGTTNVDFTAWLWGALAELRSSRETTLQIDAGGFEVSTAGAGGRFEKKVDLPPQWARGFFQLQEAMATPGTRINCRPVDLLSAIRYLRYTKAKVSPRALRYEFEPGCDARIVLEPWEHRVPLKGSSHSYSALKVIRTWGRRRLALIEPMLPFAEKVEIYLKGRALPSFYAVMMKGITFVIGLTGWPGQRWTETGGFDLLTPSYHSDEELLEKACALLQARQKMTLQDVEEQLLVKKDQASALLSQLCRRGRAVFDIQSRSYRHRRLFEELPDESILFPPDSRREKAGEYIARGAVELIECMPRETRTVKMFKTLEGTLSREVIHRDWHLLGKVESQEKVEIVLDDRGKIIFGTCMCGFFRDNLLNRGPCEHMCALFLAGESRIKDLPTSVEAPDAGAAPGEGETAEGDENDT